MIAHIPILQGLRVNLRPPMEAGVATRFAIGRYAEVVRAYGCSFDPATPYTRECARHEIEAPVAEPAGWAIDVGGYMGQIRFHGTNRHYRRAALAIGIDDPGRHGQGLGSEAIRLALDHGFSSGLHRVTVRVLASNERAIRCYRRCGFTTEGREREAAWVDGAWQDDIVMGLLDREFQALA